MINKINKPTKLPSALAKMKTVQEVHEYYQKIISCMPNNVYWLDRNCITQGCNANVLKFVGLNTVDEFIGIDYNQMGKIAGWTEGHAELYKEADMQVMASGIPLLNIEDPPIHNENGEAIYYLSSRVPVFDDKTGKVMGVVGISVDITERKRMEKELHRLEEAAQEEKKEIEFTLSNIVANMPDHIYWLDRNCILRGGNDNLARMFGLKSAAELNGLTYEQMIELANWTEGQGQSFKEAELKVMSTGVPQFDVKEPPVIIGGRVRYYVSSKVPLRNKNGEVIGVLGISTDITELQEAKEKAEAANKAKTEFIANMSHDIRTPLTGVISMSRVLEQQEQNPEEKQYASWLLESGEQLLELLNGVLDVISSNNLTEQDLREDCFNLRQSIEAIGRLEMPAIKTKGLDLQIHIDEAIPAYIITDRIKLHRILLNLLGNAIKFTKIGHVALKVKLLAKKEKAVQLEFSVIDTGIGIAPELQSKVFDRFYRVNPAYKGHYRGHGVGLHIAQKYVDLLGGEIKLTSEIEKGTTFSFVLPFKVGNEKESTVLPAHDMDEIAITKVEKSSQVIESTFAATQTVPSNSPHILLVEDNVMALRAAEIVVTQAGCQFCSVMDGEQALALVKSTHFDLILTDIGLPGMSGIDLAQRIREWEKTIPIVGLTAHAGDQTEQECLQVGMNKVLTKPANLTAIKTMLTQFIPDKISRLLEKQVEDKATPTSGLGYDLPDSEEQLFDLEQYPLLDIAEGVKILGSEAIVKEMLQQMIETSLSIDKEQIKQAFAVKDWETIEKLAHKIKGGAVYCGTIRLRYACQYLERYRKAGHLISLEKLYQQLIMTLDNTEQRILNLIK